MGIEHLENETGLRDIEYAGDGVYVGHDGYQVWVFTHDGYGVQARIALPQDGTFQKVSTYGMKRYGMLRESSDG